MSFVTRLASDVVKVEAGATAPLSVEIVNRGESSEQFEIAIEGLDPEWTAIPVPSCTAQAGETQTEKIFFKPPRQSESSAGNYPFVVKVRSLESGESRNLQGILEVKPFNHLSIEISPKKGVVSPMRHANSFEATVVNLGNTEHVLQLYGNDPEEGCAFEFESEQVTLGPGQQKSIEFEVSPTAQNLFSGTRLYGFSVTSRSVEQPSVVAIAQAQLEHRPLLSIGTMLATLLIALIAGLWIVLIPKPPTLQLSVDTRSVVRGQPVVVTWHAGGDFNAVHIASQDSVIYDGAERDGHQIFTATVPSGVNNFEIVGRSEKDGRRSAEQSILIQVTEPPKIDPPHILKFKLDQTNLQMGQQVTISYKVEKAIKAVLLPLGKELDLAGEQIQIPVDNLNTKAYTLVATNSAGVTDRRVVRVNIVQPSKASIIVFTASTRRIEGDAGTVTFNWQANDKTVRTEIVAGGQVNAVQSQGTTTVTINKTTVFTLIVYDDTGLTTKSSIRVEVIPPAKPPPLSPPGPASDPASAASPPVTNGSETGTTTGTPPNR